jgi:hypothetical protein
MRCSHSARRKAAACDPPATEGASTLRRQRPRFGYGQFSMIGGGLIDGLASSRTMASVRWVREQGKKHADSSGNYWRTHRACKYYSCRRRVCRVGYNKNHRGARWHAGSCAPSRCWTALVCKRCARYRKTRCFIHCGFNHGSRRVDRRDILWVGMARAAYRRRRSDMSCIIGAGREWQAGDDNPGSLV